MRCCERAKIREVGDGLRRARASERRAHGERTSCCLCNPGAMTTELSLCWRCWDDLWNSSVTGLTICEDKD
jgi:hypothetical protein